MDGPSFGLGQSCLPLWQLREQYARRNDHGLVPRETVAGHESAVQHSLESVWASDLPLEVGECGRQALFMMPRLDQKPGLLGAKHQKIEFSLLLVPKVAQLEITQAQVRPCLDGLEQMACDHGFTAPAFILNVRPIAKVSFRLLAQCFRDFAVPGTHQKAVVEGAERRDPGADRVLPGRPGWATTRVYLAIIIEKFLRYLFLVCFVERS
jgi:hypothetical protein